MTSGTRRHLFTVASIALLLGYSAEATPAVAQSKETPRRGGILLAAIGADAPSLDPHQEQTFATLQPVSPLYSTRLQFDPYSYPTIIGDVATEWKISSDGLTYTFKIRRDIKVHDGSPLTSADVKASYDKIIFPPEGVRSIRKLFYAAVQSVEAPDPHTVVFKLKVVGGSPNAQGVVGLRIATSGATDDTTISQTYTVNSGDDVGGLGAETGLNGLSVAAYPNPIAGAARFEYSVPTTGLVALNLFTTGGEKVLPIFEGAREAGRHTAIVDMSSIPAGVYTLVLSADGRTTARSITVVH